MKARYLGHIALFVRDLAASRSFYEELLGFQCVGSWKGRAVALSSGRTHHELLLLKCEAGRGRSTDQDRIGLYHIGIKVGDSIDELKAAKRELDAAGVPVIGASDHTVSQSLYVLDPDGNEVEVYVDSSPEIWKRDPSAVMSPIRPLNLN